MAATSTKSILDKLSLLTPPEQAVIKEDVSSDQKRVIRPSLNSELNMEDVLANCFSLSKSEKIPS